MMPSTVLDVASPVSIAHAQQQKDERRDPNSRVVGLIFFVFFIADVLKVLRSTSVLA
jgi:hypothetical protein